MKKVYRMICSLFCICLMVNMLCAFANAQEIESQNEDVCQMLTAICSDTDSSMLDFIRVANPKFYSRLTDEQQAAFDAMNYQAALNGTYSSGSARVLSGYVLHAGMTFHAERPIMYYSLYFQTVAADGGSVNLLTVGGTTTVTDNYTHDVVATSSDEDVNTDSLYIEEHTRDFVCGRYHTNTCTIYGIDPYNQPFADVATKVEYTPYYD